MRVGVAVTEDVNVGAGQADDGAVGMARLCFELGVLSRVARAGWWHAGIKIPESVAEHSLRVSQIAGMIAIAEGGNPERATILGAWHDVTETRIGDIPHSALPYLKKPDNRVIINDQVSGLPVVVADFVRGVVDEFESQDTLESHCARDADKLDCLFKALEYRDAGNNRVQGWIDSSTAKLTAQTAKEMAEAALNMSPLAWRDR